MVTKNLQEGAKVDGPMIGKIIEETVLINPKKLIIAKSLTVYLSVSLPLNFWKILKWFQDRKIKKGIMKLIYL